MYFPPKEGLRITVWNVLSWLAAGMTEQEILGDYPELETDDFPALYGSCFSTRIFPASLSAGCPNCIRAQFTWRR
jgi:hypothetical protein